MLFDQVSDSISLNTAPQLSLLQDNHTIAVEIRGTIAGLRRLGANINPSSRLPQYARMFDADVDPAPLALDRATLESSQFRTIHDALAATRDPGPWLPRLNSACRGQALAADIRSDSRARSDQFELFTMAWLTMAGFPVTPAEPDLRAHVGRVEVAFAAKRLRAIPKLRRNLRDACAQIAMHKIRGFAVIDLSFVNLVPKPVYVRQLEQQQVLAAVLLDGFAREHERDILDAARRPGVLGILLHASVPCRSIKPAARFVSRRWILCAAAESEVARRLITAIQSVGRLPSTE